LVRSANFIVPSAQIAPSLGRPLNSATVSIPIIPPNTQWGKRVNQLDLRFQKTFNFGTRGLQTNVDVYNVFNPNTVVQARNTYPSGFQVPTGILGGRLIKFGGQFTF
jgi:hypothetical protein